MSLINNELVIVRGAGDLATGVVYSLYKAHFKVIILETQHPSAIRRKVALSEAVYDGKTKVDINGNPIQGQRPMTHGERKAFWKLIKEIIRSLNP